MADTTEAQSTPAQAGVFATVELLELVLLNLDPITLFAIQRVCKQWKYLIADSHRLQERMFLRAPVCNNKPKTEIQPSTSCPTTTILPNHSAWDHYKHDNLKYNDTNENENDNDEPLRSSDTDLEQSQKLVGRPTLFSAANPNSSLANNPKLLPLLLAFKIVADETVILRF